MNKITRKNLDRKKKNLESKKKNLIQKGGSKSVTSDFKIYLYYFDYAEDGKKNEIKLTDFLKQNSKEFVKPNSNKTQIIFVENFKEENEIGSHLYTRNSIQDKTIGIKILDNITSPFLFVKKQIENFNNDEQNYILHGTMKYPKILDQEDIKIFNCKINDHTKIKNFIKSLYKNIKYNFSKGIRHNYIIFFNRNMRNDYKETYIKDSLQKMDGNGKFISNNSNSGIIFVSKYLKEYIYGDLFNIIHNSFLSNVSTNDL